MGAHRTGKIGLRFGEAPEPGIGSPFAQGEGVPLLGAPLPIQVRDAQEGDEHLAGAERLCQFFIPEHGRVYSILVEESQGGAYGHVHQYLHVARNSL